MASSVRVGQGRFGNSCSHEPHSGIRSAQHEDPSSGRRDYILNGQKILMTKTPIMTILNRWASVNRTSSPTASGSSFNVHRPSKGTKWRHGFQTH